MGPLLAPTHLINLILVLLLAFAVYFFPVVVARARRCQDKNGILVVDLFLGWTFIGWVVALAWAVSGKQEAQ